MPLRLILLASNKRLVGYRNQSVSPAEPEDNNTGRYPSSLGEVKPISEVIERIERIDQRLESLNEWLGPPISER